MDEQLKIEDKEWSPDPCESTNRGHASRFTVSEMFVLAVVASEIADAINQDLEDIGEEEFPMVSHVSNAANRLVMNFKGERTPHSYANVSHDSLDKGSGLVSVEIVGGLTSSGNRQLAKALNRVLK